MKNRNIWSEAEEKSAEGKDGKGKLLRDGDGRTVWYRHRRLHKWSSRPKKVKKNLPFNPPLKNEKSVGKREFQNPITPVYILIIHILNILDS